MTDPLQFPDPIAAFDRDTLDRLLHWAAQQDASDVALLPNDSVWMRRHGAWISITNRSVSTSEIGFLLESISGQANAPALAQSGTDVDFAHEIQVSRAQRLRFRCNATGCRDGWGNGITMVIRTIPGFPPTPEELGVDEDLLRAFCPKYGLVLVTGPVGSGKSTLLFAVLRSIAETQARHILTYESPIEFDLMGLPNRIAPVVQTEIPKQLRSFDVAPRNSLRRAGDVVLFGESRDRETMRGMSIEAETGVAVYSTVHTNSVAETVSRMVREFGAEERDGMAATLLSAVRLIVHQRLVPRADGQGRIALREHLVYDEDVRRHLTGLSLPELAPATEALMEAQGNTLLSDARCKFEAGLIDEREYEMFRAIKGRKEAI